MITSAKIIEEYLDGGSKKVEYIEDSIKKYCFMDYSFSTGQRGTGKMYEFMSMTGSKDKFFKELDIKKSETIKLLLEK